MEDRLRVAAHMQTISREWSVLNGCKVNAGMVQQVVEQPENDSPAVRRHGIYHGRLCKGL